MMVTPTLGRPRRRPYLERDARAVRIALNSLRLAHITVLQHLEQCPEVAGYLAVMRPAQMAVIRQDAFAVRLAANQLVDALRSDGDPPAGGS